MRVVIAPDSFKGTLSAVEAATAMSRGIRSTEPSAETVMKPMADGGEGTLDVLLHVGSGKRVSVPTVDPLNRSIDACFGRFSGDMAVVELASSSGLLHLSISERTPDAALRASTFGTGVMMDVARKAGAKKIILTLGGSATTDGGYGLLAALGAAYYDPQGAKLDGRDASNLKRTVRVELSGFMERVHALQFEILTDVQNPLCGLDGAAHVYGPQKGLDCRAIQQRDEELARWQRLLSTTVNRELTQDEQCGLGAAGGSALPLVLLARAKVSRGAIAISNVIGLEKAIARTDYVLTGEGRTDHQSLQGKVVGTVINIAKQVGVPSFVVSGALGAGAHGLYEQGAHAMIAATPLDATEDELSVRAAEWLEQATRQLFQDIGSRH